MTEKLYNAKEAGILLQVSDATVRNWAAEGQITHGRTLGRNPQLRRYRFRLEDINPARQKQGLDPLTEEEAALLLANES